MELDREPERPGPPKPSNTQFQKRLESNTRSRHLFRGHCSVPRSDANALENPIINVCRPLPEDDLAAASVDRDWPVPSKEREVRAQEPAVLAGERCLQAQDPPVHSQKREMLCRGQLESPPGVPEPESGSVPLEISVEGRYDTPIDPCVSLGVERERTAPSRKKEVLSRERRGPAEEPGGQAAPTGERVVPSRGRSTEGVLTALTNPEYSVGVGSSRPRSKPSCQAASTCGLGDDSQQLVETPGSPSRVKSLLGTVAPSPPSPAPEACRAKETLPMNERYDMPCNPTAEAKRERSEVSQKPSAMQVNQELSKGLVLGLVSACIL